MKTFRYEADLVEAFVSNYKDFKSHLVVKELSIRFGNIDVVNIQNIKLPFNSEQTEILTRPSCALTFMRIKNARPVSKKTLSDNIGLSPSTLDNTLQLLTKSNLIYKNSNNHYLRKEKFVFPDTIITGYEAKLDDFNKAFYQGKLNKNFVDYSYLVFPLEKAKKIFNTKYKLLETNGIGLIGVTEDYSEQLIKAKKTSNIKSHIRLLNMTKTVEKLAYI